MPGIGSSCIALVKGGQVLGQAVILTWHDDRMDVIGHEAICPNLDWPVIQQVDSKPQIRSIIVIVKKGRLSTYAALCDVMSKVRNNKPAESGHSAAFIKKPNPTITDLLNERFWQIRDKCLEMRCPAPLDPI